MPYFTVTNSTATGGNAQQSLATTYHTLCGVAASTGILNPPVSPGLTRGRVFDILVGTDGAPLDNYLEYDLARVSNIGSSAVWLGSLSSISTALALDPADAGCQSFTVNNASAESNITITAETWYVGVNQRASYRWVAAPGSEMVWPATASAGFVLRARSGAYTGTATGTILFSE